MPPEPTGGWSKIPHQPAPPSASLKSRVLIVEDSVDTAESLALLLKIYGYRVDVAHSGQAALRAAGEDVPDVVLLDLGLPGMDGYAVAKSLRENLAAKCPYLIAVTGHGQQTDRVRSREAGIHLHLVKPVEPNFLRTLLASVDRTLPNPTGDAGSLSALELSANARWDK